MKLRWRAALIIGIGIAVAVTGFGCAKTKQPAEATSAKTSVPLPKWAPENPSPEFLRAARVLKPWPSDSRPAGNQSELARRALDARYARTLPAAWELFGSLSDEQIERFLETQHIRLRVRDLSKKQRAALDRYFDIWRKAIKELPPQEEEYGEDWLVALYKFGAKEDLSNVEMEFVVRANRRVVMFMRVRKPDGSLSVPLPAGLGRI